MNLPARKPSKLDYTIDQILDRMSHMEPETETYKECVARLDEVMKMRNSSRISPDTFATVLGNLLGILTIVSYEQKHVMVSKALGLFTRGKSTT